MRRPGVAVVLSALVVLSAAGCGNSAGATTTSGPGAGAAAPSASAPPVAKSAASSLAGLVVVPKGYVNGDRTMKSTEQSGPFSRESYLKVMSGSPAEDRALLLNAHFAEGYQAYRTSADRKKHYTVRIFRVGSKAQADVLRRGLWAQETHSRAFAVPGVPDALTDARVDATTSVGRIEAVAESSFVVGTVLTQISVTQTGDLTADLAPDTALVAAITKQQRQSLTRKSG